MNPVKDLGSIRARLPSSLATLAGGDNEEVLPVPIPNTEVKLFRANGTAPLRVWESR